ncbi:MAG: helix-turn-helix domain-containing protein [Dehalococcoidia bacterium]|nr:helix-turn-helix domain-containing protein [Dehalococcoidia bacterium]
MGEELLSIGQVAARTGCKAPTIRYYEELGLLGAPARTAGGHRTYSGHDVRRLNFIRRSRDLGFSLDTIRDLLDLVANPERSCADVDQLATEHLGQIAEKLRLLSAMQGALQDMLDQCSHTTIHECRIIEALSPESGR